MTELLQKIGEDDFLSEEDTMVLELALRNALEASVI